ncbi:hypothetical protein C7441_11459 [Pseudaminobacter salicylatoxidans]|uniref:Uncharacterized protein n=1 Tax=Pseudaminobacter salicylatoxidans TaxID=93369 RepID=A0A316CKL8_PSESE|nr:hypothetical protein C7441_11459 [Pseudaminobacter salicylatoxidans]
MSAHRRRTSLLFARQNQTVGGTGYPVLANARGVPTSGINDLLVKRKPRRVGFLR